MPDPFNSVVWNYLLFFCLQDDIICVNTLSVTTQKAQQKLEFLHSCSKLYKENINYNEQTISSHKRSQKNPLAKKIQLKDEKAKITRLAHQNPIKGFTQKIVFLREPTWRCDVFLKIFAET